MKKSGSHHITLGSKWTLTSTKFRHPDHDMVTTLASDQMRHNSIVKQQVFMNASGRASCICVAWCTRTISPESRSQYLNGLENRIFPMFFLKADDVVAVDESSEKMFQFPGDL